MSEEKIVSVTPPALESAAKSPNKLTPADMAQIKALQAEKMQKGQGHCEMCGTNNWHVQERLWTPIFAEFTEDGGVGTNFERIMPMVLMICFNCGNAKFLHAQTLGLERMTTVPLFPKDSDGD